MKNLIYLLFTKAALILLLSFSGMSNIKGQIDDPEYPYHPKVNLPFSSSDLPVVVIELDKRMADKNDDKRISAQMKVIWHKDGSRNSLTDTDAYDYNGNIGIKYRGNSSFWSSDKKPFAVRLQDENEKKQKASILGMGEDEDWALLAPFNDGTMIRDVLAFELMRGALEYVPSGRYCELVLNGVYQGVYIMTARVRQGPHRINVKAPTADEGDGLTGGYHLEIDRNDDPGFFSTMRTKDLFGNTILRYIPFFQYKYPDEEDLSTAQKLYIKNHVEKMEKAIAGEDYTDPVKGYRAYLDTLSLMDYYIAQELTKNIDAYRLSTPMYKYPDSVDPRFKFSIWDFNIAMGNANYHDGWSTTGWVYNNNRFHAATDEPLLVPYMFKRILEDEVFRNNLKERWKEHRRSRFTDEHVRGKIDSLTHLLAEASTRNFAIWQTVQAWPKYFDGTYADEVDYLRTWMLKRLDWLDSQWIAEEVNHIPNGDFEGALRATSNLALDPSLSEWVRTGTPYLMQTDVYGGSFALRMQKGQGVSQVITELSPGLYTLRLWAKTTGDPKGSLYLRYHDLPSGGTEFTKTIATNESYYQIEINNIEVTNPFMEIGFRTKSTERNMILYLDDISFVKQTGPLANATVGPHTKDVNIFVDRRRQTITFTPTADTGKGERLEIYDTSGKQIYSSVLKESPLTIGGIFDANQVYILKAGEATKKVVM